MEEKPTSITPGFDRGQTVKDIFGLYKPYLANVEKAEKDVIGAEADLLRATEAQKIRQAEEKTKVDRKAVEDEQAATERYKRQKEAEPIPAFVPTRDSAEDLAKLFSFIGVAGTLVGRGAGKQSAMGAMAAMNGMMQGWRQGRMDLYNQEKAKFDKDFARVQKIHQDLAKELDIAVKTIATNRELGLKIAEEAALNAGSDVLLAKIRKGELIGARDMQVKTADAFKEALKQTLTREERIIAAQSAERAAAARATGRVSRGPSVFSRNEKGEIVIISGAGVETIPGTEKTPLPAERKADDAEELARLKADLKGGKEPPLAIQSKNDLRNTLIPKIEEAIPIMDRLHKQNKWNDLTILLGMPYGTNLAEMAFKDDPEALNLILTLAYFRSKEFETAGKALTKKEDQILAPIYRSDFRAYEGIRNSLVQAQKMLTEEQKAIEANYPWVRAYNRSLRGEPVEDVETPAAPSGAPSATPKAPPAATSGTGKKRAVSDVEVKAYADKHGLTPEQARKVLTNMGYQ